MMWSCSGAMHFMFYNTPLTAQGRVLKRDCEVKLKWSQWCLDSEGERESEGGESLKFICKGLQ